MKRIMVRYKVKAGHADENERYIAEVFRELDRLRPDGLRYASFKLDDGLSFVHIASVDRPDGRNPLLDLPSFQAFTAGIKDRTEEPPVTVELKEIGAYGLFGR